MSGYIGKGRSVVNVESYTKDQADAEFTSKSGDTMTGDLSFGDNDKAIFGAGSDLQIYHDGSNSYVKDAGAGNLNLQGENVAIENTSGVNYFVGINGGASNVYHSGSLKLATTSTGIDVTGNATFADNGKAIFGAGSDLQIYHDGVDSFVSDQGTGRLILRGSSQVRLETASGTQMISADDGGAAKLYHNGAKKLATTSTGIDVTGTVNATSFTGDGSNLTGVGGSTSLGAVGTYALMGRTNGGGVSPGSTVSGSSMRYSSAYGYNNSNHGLGTTSPSGTWRCMGHSGAFNFSAASGLAVASSVYVRIS